MMLILLSLLCIGLCAGQFDETDGLLPNPTLSAWPSTVVPLRSKVTLKCSSPTTSQTLVFTRGGILLESLLPSNATGWTELPLSDLQQHDAGEYACEYYFKGAPFIRSQPSSVLFLVVTGALPKPSLRSHQKGNVTAGEDVTLQCDQPGNSTESIMFALLRTGHPTPIQRQENRGLFLLQAVTVSATGNYSCVYYRSNFPYSASFLSEELELTVTALQTKTSEKSNPDTKADEETTDPCEGCPTSSPKTDETEETKPIPKRVSLASIHITLIVICILVVLFVIIFICKCILRGASSDKTAGSSKEFGEVVADVPSVMESGLPA